MDKSEQINDLALALVKAQGEIEGAVKTGTNPHLKSKYADLSSISDACRPALNKHGLSVVQMPHSVCDEQGRTHLYVRTMLLHTTGQFISDTCEIPLQKQDAQGVGSAITYGRRYGLAAIVGVCPVDDDGEAAVGRGKQHRGDEPKPLPDVNPNPAPTPPSPAQAALAPKFDPKAEVNAYLDNLAVLHEMDIKQVRKIAKQWLKENMPVDLDNLDKDGVYEVNKALGECFTKYNSDEPRGA